ncbi:MAG TPA: hypothetical protein DCP38_12030, partial [Acidobacteria bacterium]|nr:hypothetical protein [Acidobacteriota bacterium]
MDDDDAARADGGRRRVILERRGHGSLERGRIDLGRERYFGQPIAHRPVQERPTGERGADRRRIEEDVGLAEREHRAAVAFMEDGRADQVGRPFIPGNGDAHSLSGAIDTNGEVADVDKGQVVGEEIGLVAAADEDPGADVLGDEAGPEAGGFVDGRRPARGGADDAKHRRQTGRPTPGLPHAPPPVTRLQDARERPIIAPPGPNGTVCYNISQHRPITSSGSTLMRRFAISGWVSAGLALALVMPAGPASAQAPTPAADTLLPVEQLSPSFLGMYRKVMEIEDEIRGHTERYGLHFDLARAVCLYESGGNAGLSSWVGARGYFQVMPATFRSLRVETNIEAGIKYLSQLVDRFDREDYAIAGYNGGP